MTGLSTPPPEHSGGQDPDPPDPRLLLAALLPHLVDLIALADHIDGDVQARHFALIRAIRRYLDHHRAAELEEDDRS